YPDGSIPSPLQISRSKGVRSAPHEPSSSKWCSISPAACSVDARAIVPRIRTQQRAAPSRHPYTRCKPLIPLENSNPRVILDHGPPGNHVCPREMNLNIQTDPRLEYLAEAPLPTPYGQFRVIVFRYRDPEAHPGLSDEHLAL